MSKPFARALILVAMLVSLVPGSAVLAQVDDEVISGVQFNFTPPGARSLGLGGAFLAVANDATTAFTNPAGLVNLTQQEVSVEGRTFSYSTLFTQGGHADCAAGGCVSTPASGFGFDTRNGLQFAETNDDTNGLSFVSYVMPVGDFRVAFFRHELVNFKSSFRTDGAFVENTPDGPCNPQFLSNGIIDVNTVLGCLRLFPIDTDLDLSIDNYAVSFAYKFGESFSLGIGINYYQFDIGAVTNRYDTPILGFTAPELAQQGSFFGAPNRSTSNVFAQQIQDGSDNDIAINVGFLWKLNRFFSVGGAYRDGASFSYTYSVVCGPSDPLFCADLGLEGSAEATFNVPTVWGLGLAFKPTDNLTITLDYDNVEYGALVKDFTVLADSANTPSDFKVDDADEVHVGLEYVFANLRNPVIIRVGAWEDPAHQIRYVGNQPATSVVLWQGSNVADDETHVSAGLGFIIGENFSIDLAYDSSNRLDIGALSAVFRW